MRCAIHIGIVPLVLIGATGSCRSEGALTARDAERVTTWLECIECTEGEVDSLVALAARHPDVVDTLHRRLITGMAADRAAQVVADLGVSYARDTAWYSRRGWSLDSAGLGDSTLFVADGRARRDVLVQEHAAEALGCIATDTAVAILTSPRVIGQLPQRLADWLVTVGDSFHDPAYRDRACR